MIVAQHKQREGIRIREIPRLTAPQKISQLNFSHNDIRTIPAHLAAAVHLQMLDLSHNRISNIDHLPLLVTLKAVNLSHNLITALPSKISAMLELECLDVRYNKVSVLANLKAVRDLVKVRVAQRRGWVEVKAEGNPVMARRSNREVFERWVNPTVDSQMNVTRKRINMSLQANKETSMIQTYRSQHLQPRSSSYHRRNVSQHAPSASSIKEPSPDITIITPNLAITESDGKPTPNQEDQMPEVDQVMTGQQDIRGLEEWFIRSMDVLHRLHSNFKLMATNEDTNQLDSSMKQLLTHQSNSARNLIEAILEYLRCALEGSLTPAEHQVHISSVSSLNLQIKVYHMQILQQLQHHPQTPLKIYKPWVAQFKKLKFLIQQVPLKITSYQLVQQRHKIILQMSSISPQKQLPGLEVGRVGRDKTEQSLNLHGSPSTDKRQLNDLLFSRSQEENLLLSEEKQKMNSSQVTPISRNIKTEQGEKRDCDSCQLLKWEQTRLREQIEELKQQNMTLQSQNKEHLTKIEHLQQLKVRYCGLSDRQELIIEELEGLRPSTYQNILLEQAKAIEMMMEHGGAQSGWGTKQTPTQGKLAIEGHSHNHISEFTCVESREMSNPFSQPTRNSSYFKNKQFTTVNQTQQQSSQQRQEEKRGREVVVSQFDGQGSEGRERTSKQHTQSSHMQSHPATIQEEAHSVHYKSIQNMPNNSQVSVINSRSGGTFKKHLPSQPRQPLKDISNRRQNASVKRSHHQSQTTRKDITQTFSKPTSKHSVSSSHSLKRYTQLNYSIPHNQKPNSYLPIPSNQRQNYKKFVQYHLRNSIIQILSKKHNISAIDPFSNLSHHKYIHKEQEGSGKEKSTRRQSLR